MRRFSQTFELFVLFITFVVQFWKTIFKIMSAQFWNALCVQRLTSQVCFVVLSRCNLPLRVPPPPRSTWRVARRISNIDKSKRSKPRLPGQVMVEGNDRRHNLHCGWQHTDASSNTLRQLVLHVAQNRDASTNTVGQLVLHVAQNRDASTNTVRQLVLHVAQNLQMLALIEWDSLYFMWLKTYRC
jgi:hypothetical protein